MWSNTKLLIIFSLLVILLGFGFLWFGFGQKNGSLPNQIPIVIAPTPSPSESTPSAVSGLAGQKVLVTRVIDGDTIAVEGGLIVRLIGIDTPETKDPRKPVGCFGKQAASETKRLLEGKLVILQKDISETDKYKRALRYVFLPLEGEQLLFVNDHLVRQGFAKVLTYPPDVKFNEQFRQAEREAKIEKRGLWGRC